MSAKPWGIRYCEQCRQHPNRKPRCGNEQCEKKYSMRLAGADRVAGAAKSRKCYKKRGPTSSNSPAAQRSRYQLMRAAYELVKKLGLLPLLEDINANGHEPRTSGSDASELVGKVAA